MQLRQGNVFTRVCHSVHGRGGRHQRSFLRLCFYTCLSVHRGVYPIACWDTPPSLADTPPLPLPSWADTPQVDTPSAVHAGIWSTSGRYASHWNAILCLYIFQYSAVRIPLECNLVFIYFSIF